MYKDGHVQDHTLEITPQWSISGLAHHWYIWTLVK